jgi:hypothetical protein
MTSHSPGNSNHSYHFSIHHTAGYSEGINRLKITEQSREILEIAKTVRILPIEDTFLLLTQFNRTMNHFPKFPVMSTTLRNIVNVFCMIWLIVWKRILLMHSFKMLCIFCSSIFWTFSCLKTSTYNKKTKIVFQFIGSQLSSWYSLFSTAVKLSFIQILWLSQRINSLKSFVITDEGNAWNLTC